MAFLVNFLIQFDDVSLKFDVSRYDYPMRIRSCFSLELLLYICIDERMNTRFSKNEIKFKNIQKMRELSKVFTNFLTVPRILA